MKFPSFFAEWIAALTEDQRTALFIFADSNPNFTSDIIDELMKRGPVLNRPNCWTVDDGKC